MNKTVTELIEEVANDVCMNLCKYTDTTDENCECDYIREHGECPIQRLY